jgi:hypothetical protein
MSRTAVPIAPSLGNNLIDELAAIHEAAHVVHAHINVNPIHSVEIDGKGRGGGQFRPFAGPDLMPLLSGREEPIHIETSDKSRRGWCKTLVSFIVPKFAQRRYAGRAGDSMCEHDDRIVNRVLTSICRSLEDERRMHAQIQDEAETFVNTYWGEILLVARAIYRHGRLDKYQIIDILRALPSKQSAFDYATGLIKDGRVNWGPFTWDSPDDDDLLDDYDLAAGEVEDHYPFGRDGEVYVEALKDALKAGGVVAEYAAKLLKDITSEKAQAKANTPNPRAHGRDPDMRWRHDGYLKPLR